MRPNTVLIAEDDGVARSGLAELVGQAGFEGETAADGCEALERVADRAPAVVLLDVWMPKMDGLQVLRHLRERPAQPKVIVMTADDTPETLLLSLRGHAHRLTANPIRPAALLEMLHETIQAPRDIASIVVLSARPGWIEVLVPCERSVAERFEEFLNTLGTDLPDEVRKAAALVFRELLLDAMSRGGTFDTNRRVRIACLRTARLLMYRIADAGQGFRGEGLAA